MFLNPRNMQENSLPLQAFTGVVLSKAMEKLSTVTKIIPINKESGRKKTSAWAKPVCGFFLMQFARSRGAFLFQLLPLS